MKGRKDRVRFCLEGKPGGIVRTDRKAGGRKKRRREERAGEGDNETGDKVFFS